MDANMREWIPDFTLVDDTSDTIIKDKFLICGCGYIIPLDGNCQCGISYNVKSTKLKNKGK